MTSHSASDSVFGGSVPDIYDTYLVPLIFEEYADDLVRRLSGLSCAHVLELAAGTGVVTRRLAAALGPTVEIVASDLNADMLDRAAAAGTIRPVEWRQADAMNLGFKSGRFDAVVCQFGAMFFPDKVKAFAEARRVLKSEGLFVFNTWDRIETNEFAHVVSAAVASLFPEDPPLFLRRTPHSYHEESQIRADLVGAGFTDIAFEVMEARSTATEAREAAVAYCHGTPLRNEIETRRPGALADATQLATAALTQRFGPNDLNGLIRGFVVTATSV